MLIHKLSARLRTLFRLIERLPNIETRISARDEARKLIRERCKESDPQKLLDYQKELVSRIAYLRIITPKDPSHVSSSAGTTYVLRDGHLVEGSGQHRGGRIADGSITTEDAMQRNNRDFKRFFGADKPKSGVFF
ncbi:hypothetical protein CEUSTIGMA_g9135.t1 [Chlamydomonas eustigma]|uniref:Uncharacterized protein n=1 Tax=Chlamydomonas eustigma TaxID=1157962 RepID=A0A250XF58_9CHLO|nr:hypothetical protein CEUSTIGMA_g9135.t1 [Chlamydomonas eustigma]|eukprot:GAX81707.1 hypothetical protein CEUSTIGMA_g9135.t1 [Chlamydomonas eustigma]